MHAFLPVMQICLADRPPWPLVEVMVSDRHLFSIRVVENPGGFVVGFGEKVAMPICTFQDQITGV
jgi:hypothetical protein